jgi:uncharacterized protein (DUF58 family)
MIYPTARAILLAALGAPLGLALVLAGGPLWLAGVAWTAGVVAALVADAMLATGWRSAEVALVAPPTLFLGRPAEVNIEIRFPRRAPQRVELSLQADERLSVSPATLSAPVLAGLASATFMAEPMRRGQAELQMLWVRWTGPLGLAFVQRREAVGLRSSVIFDVPGLKEAAAGLASTSLLSGAHLQFELGGASEFHALVDYRPGMNPRMVDWKQSARHRALLAKEFEAERNHHIVLAIDAGRQMCEPVRGLPRLDRVLQAGLVLAFSALKAGDRVGLYSFDEKPRIWTGVLSGQGAFAALQKLAALIDYEAKETNYTLGLVQLAANLQRRSMIVVFTDFTDSTTAELMIENVARLLKTHLVVFVVTEDEELDRLELAQVDEPGQVTMAVLAGTLAAERELVIGRLRRMGVDILQAEIDDLGPALLARYAELKQRNRL